MKTMYSEEYYSNNAIIFEGKRGVITPEEDLAYKMSAFDKNCFSDEDWENILRVVASKIVESLSKELLEKKQLYIRVRKGSSCLGYVSAAQETREAHKIIQTFEYNCYKLAQFKKRYNL